MHQSSWIFSDIFDRLLILEMKIPAFNSPSPTSKVRCLQKLHLQERKQPVLYAQRMNDKIYWEKNPDLLS